MKEYEVGISKDIQQKYGNSSEDLPKIQVNPENVPQNLHPLIPLVELFGINDDILRNERVEKAPHELKDLLIQLCERYIDELDDWLGGQADNTDVPEEYYYFTSMRMASWESIDYD